MKTKEEVDIESSPRTCTSRKKAHFSLQKGASFLLGDNHTKERLRRCIRSKVREKIGRAVPAIYSHLFFFS